MTVQARRLSADQEGFSLIEMLVSVSIMLAVTAGVFSLLNPAHGTYQAQPEVSDMQQRMRVGADTLFKDLVMAGAGSYMGTQTGSLLYFFAPILPFRMGRINQDPPGTYRSDTITLMFVPPTVAQTTIAQPMPQTSAEIKVNQESGCPNNDPLCGFSVGMTVLIYDDTGSYDTFTLTEIQDNALHLQHNEDDFSKVYSDAPPAKITQINSYTYYLNTATNQLIQYDDGATETPIADNVVGLKFEYYGDAQPPALLVPGDLSKGMTYGPKPPAVGVTAGAWPPGENCTIQVVGGQQVPRLAVLGGGTGLVKLDQSILTDGPWCPDAANPNRWDADLMRVRKIAVTLRVQAAVASLRGTAGTLFAKGGTATAGNQIVPDQEVRFEVTPRNLNLGR